MPTLGYTGTNEDTTDANGTGGIIVTGGAVTTVASGGKVGAGHAFMHGLSADVGGTQQKSRLIIYKADGAAGAPGTLVGVTDEVIITTSVADGTTVNYPTWVSFGGAPVLAGSTNYWVGFWYGTQDGAKVIDMYLHTASLGAYFASGATYSTTGNPPTPGWGSIGPFNVYDLYFDYAALGGPTMWLRA